MNEPRLTRAEQLWKRLAQIFGADALERKFGLQPPEEWIETVEELNDAQLANGLRELMKSGKTHVPALPEFIKHCRDAREFSTPRDRQLLGSDQFDAWGMAANRHFLAIMMRRVVRKLGGYNEQQTRLLLSAKNQWAQDMRETDQLDGVDIETQKGVWAYHIRMAESGISHESKSKS